MGISVALKNPQLLDDLAQLVDSDEDLEQGVAHLSYSNGLMTAVIIGPEFISSSEWLPLIVDQESTQDDLDLRLTVTELALFEYDKILESLKADETVYEPFFWTDGNQNIVTRDWAEGFLAGVGLHASSWAPLLDGSDPYAQTVLYVLLQEEAFCTKLAENGIDLDEVSDSIRDETSNFVQGLYDRWSERTPSRRAHKAGRNDPCPCGSGQKYKKCCLN